MNKRIDRIATLANLSAYASKDVKKYIDGAPHIKHSSLKKLYHELVLKVFISAKKYKKIPKVLDLGAGEGSATLPFLELGAKVVAIDISESQLALLRNKCKFFSNMIKIKQEDLNKTLSNKNEKYDIIVANSLLHHIPNYMEIIERMIKKLNPYGQLFFFQDPLRYDTVNKFTNLFTNFAYLSWRIFQDDVVGGLKRRWRRGRGIYFDDSVYDNAEYHVIRNGVDQNAILRFLEKEDMDFRIISYFSTQSSFFQIVGSRLNMKNTFAIIAQKRD